MTGPFCQQRIADTEKSGKWGWVVVVFFWGGVLKHSHHTHLYEPATPDKEEIWGTSVIHINE